MSTLYLVLLTYAASLESPRSLYAETTLFSTLNNLKTSASLKVHIADDGSDPAHVARLIDVCQHFKIEPTLTNAKRFGYGASYNLASQVTHRDGEYFLMLEDDWQLTREFNIDPLITALEDGKEESALGCIRLGYIGWTQSLEGSIRKFNNQSFLVFSPDSSEPHVWAGHPRLESLWFQKRLGPWPEGIDAGSTEFVVAQRDKSRMGVGWPLDMNINASQDYCNLYAHIGAVQARTDQ